MGYNLDMKALLLMAAMVLTMFWSVPVCAAPGDRAAVGEPAVDAVPEAVLPDAPMVLEARPSSVQLSQSVNFDQDGNVNHESNSLSINLNLFYDDAIQPMAYGDLVLTRAITSSGEQLEFDPEQNNRRARRIHGNRQQNGRPYFNSYFNLPVPERP